MRQTNKIISNETVNPQKLAVAEKIIMELQAELPHHIARGSGPFLAAIYDKNDHLIAKESNSVVRRGCSHNHAEMNTILAAEKKMKTYDLSGAKIYVTAEPCMMCLGGILWSGIKEVYYGVPSKTVEKITGFDEGFKPRWLTEFKKRGITVYGNIAPRAGEQVLADYVKKGHIVYKTNRD